MVTTRRNGAIASTKAVPVVSMTSASKTSPLSTPIPWFLLVFPATLLLGSLFSAFDPVARNKPYDVVSQSHPADDAPSYFAQKRNVFNVYFVKIGWFWITTAYFTFLATRGYRIRSDETTSRGGAEVVQAVGTRERVQGLFRWIIVTVWWIAVTQWFFGAPLIDRGFRLTGGKCDIILEEGAKDAKELFTAAACKVAGGSWKGGYDISGHVFLLVLGTSFLALEVLPVVIAAWDKPQVAEKKESVLATEQALGWPVWFVGIVAGLNWWMLLMTAAYFHTWFEKLTGLLVAFAALGSVYFLPLIFPVMRQVVGEPGP